MNPIFLNDKIIGRTTSGNYSFNFKKNLAFGYIEGDFSNEDLNINKLYIEVEKKRFEAELLLKPLKENRYKEI
jgi:4-methylaminobutanoate oxidase (formaldehyde-forming)